MEQSPKGYARLYLSDALIRHAPTRIEKPKAGAIAWGTVEVKELFDTFASFLLLPESFTLLGVFFDAVMYQWLLIVESAELPVVDQTMVPPVLEFTYQRTDDGRVHFSNYSVTR